MPESLSRQQAQQLILHAQQLPPTATSTLDVIKQLGYIQIDTISVVQRAHHHVLWSRYPAYRPQALDDLVAKGDVFEYWSHAAAYLPMQDYRFSLVRKQAIASGQLSHWYQPEPELMQYVLARIQNEGALQSNDFEHQGKKIADWGSKPAKQALEHLFMSGTLMIAKRVNFHKVYDLTERVLPSHIDTRVPSEAEYARHLIICFLQAQGLGQVREMAYLLKKTKPLLQRYLSEMLEAGEVQSVTVNGIRERQYYALPALLSTLNTLPATTQNNVHILSPFDNVLIQRQRIHDFFQFDYQIECYVPAAKRRFGYFALPILWNGQFVARMDCKADRQQKILQIHSLALEETHLKPSQYADFKAAFLLALEKFRHFNDCTQIMWGKITPHNAMNVF